MEDSGIPVMIGVGIPIVIIVVLIALSESGLNVLRVLGITLLIAGTLAVLVAIVVGSITLAIAAAAVIVSGAVFTSAGVIVDGQRKTSDTLSDQLAALLTIWRQLQVKSRSERSQKEQAANEQGDK